MLQSTGCKELDVTEQLNHNSKEQNHKRERPLSTDPSQRLSACGQFLGEQRHQRGLVRADVSP